MSGTRPWTLAAPPAVLAAALACLLPASGTASTVPATSASAAPLQNLVAGDTYTGRGQLAVRVTTAPRRRRSRTRAVVPRPAGVSVSFSVDQARTAISSLSLSKFGCGFAVPSSVSLTGGPAGSAQGQTLAVDNLTFHLRVIRRTRGHSLDYRETGSFPASGAQRMRFRITRVSGATTCVADAQVTVGPAPIAPTGG